VHKVTLTGYYINKYEATVGEFDVYTRANKLPLLAEERRPYSKNYEPDSVLSLYLDWYDASDYCQWLGEITGLPFDLPTEAQWEYAARSRGKAVRFATDNGELEMGRNHSPTFADLIDLDSPGKYPPNPLGLYDMTGNTNEWVRDWHYGSYYRVSPELNPTGAEEGAIWSNNKVTRGFGRGNFNIQSNLVFRRVIRSPKNDGAATGFRCAIYSDNPIL
jgi:formylglycine-generating enzyme required for sulfatase activity